MTTPTIAPVALSFGSTGGVSSVGAPPAKTTGGIAGRDVARAAWFDSAVNQQKTELFNKEDK